MKKLKGFRTILAAALISASTFWQSDTVMEWIKAQPLAVSLSLFVIITVLRVLTTTPLGKK